MPTEPNTKNSLQFADVQIPTEITVQALAQLATSYIEYKGQKEIWEARLLALRLAYEKHGESERNTLEKRRIEADLANTAIQAARELSDSNAVVRIFKYFMDETPDLFSKTADLIGIKN